MLMIYHIITDEAGKAVGFEDEYHYVEMYPLLNPEFLVNPIVYKVGDDLVVQFCQEGKY